MKAQVVSTILICASAIPSDIRSKVPEADAREKGGSRTNFVAVPFLTPGTYVSAFSWSEYVFNCTKILPPSS